MNAVALGLDVCIDSPPEVLRHARAFGVLSNQAAVDRDFRCSWDRLAQRFPGKIKAVFGPQHGLWSAQQDNMVETEHGRHPRLSVPVHSLYSETRKPTQQMLQGLDALVVDLPDVGARPYTYTSTLALCLEACAQAGIPLVLLDRPNPLGGELAEGPLLDPAFASFVGRVAVPMRHGLTLGEMARLCNDSLGLGCELAVIAMRGWRRSMRWADTGLPWVPPSPNLPRPESAQVYPGQVLFEGTCVSEGRGTTTPFEQFGAPWIDPWQLLPFVTARQLTGCVLRPVQFEPAFQKWRGQLCGGLFVHVTDAAAFRPYRTAVVLLRATFELWPHQFKWLQPPYEYETVKAPIDILSGSSALRSWIESFGPWSELEALTAAPADWWQGVRRLLLY